MSVHRNCPCAEARVLRREYPEVPVRVEYELSERSGKLQPILRQLIVRRLGLTQEEG